MVQERRYKEGGKHAAEQADFIRRHMKPSVLPIAVSAFSAFAVITLAALQMEFIGGSATLVTVVACVFLVLLALLVVTLDKMRDTVFSNEFETALFAGAAGTGAQFLLLIKRNRQEIYGNPAFQKFFGIDTHNQPRTFDVLLDQIGVDPEDRDRMLLGILGHDMQEYTVSVQSMQGKREVVRMVMEPIMRPEGYFVLRAYEIEKLNAQPKQVTKAQTQGMAGDSVVLGWKEVLQLSPVGMVLLDAEGKITLYNNAFQSLIHQSDVAIEQQPLSQFFDETSQFNIKTLLEGGVTVHQPTPLDVRLLDQTHRAALLTILPLQQQENHGYIAYILDISQQKDLEQRFVHSQKMQAVGQLAGGIAHDFNNLLTAMIGFCDLLLLRHTPGEQSFADIMQIKQNANRAANLVRQLLAFSRKQTLQPEVLDLTDVLAELSHLLHRLLGENIELNLHHGHDVWSILADQGQLEQVVINLAVNARDAMLAGNNKGGKLIISTENVVVDSEYSLPQQMVPAQQDDRIVAGEYVCIRVVDTGCGIPHEKLSQIFEPFYTTKKIGEGTGLGLATVCGIIQQTGGYVFVQSVLGHGTEFFIYLKRHVVTNHPQRIIHGKQHHSVQDLTGVGTIMLVEDEDPVRMFSARALKNKGYTVLEADCAEEALRVLDDHDGAIDLMITDVMMPGKTGPELVQEIEKMHPEMKVIFISGYGEDAFKDVFGDVRSFNFLPKPFTLAQLASKVKEVLEN